MDYKVKVKADLEEPVHSPLSVIVGNLDADHCESPRWQPQRSANFSGATELSGQFPHL